jgi:hypothetical protein
VYRVHQLLHFQEELFLKTSSLYSHHLTILTKVGKKSKRKVIHPYDNFSPCLGREFRLWTVDKIVAAASGFVIGTTTWVLIGTTTLISVILWLVNQFDEDGRITQMVSNYLTSSSGLQIRYEHAEGTSIFKEGTIRLKK